MNYLSVCSGIEAATVGWHSLGWKPVAFSEIEPFPCAALAHHYPNVPNWGDMTKFKEWPDANIDVLVGGTPCQSFSVAGLRKGLADPRGNLMLTYLAIAAKYRPKWVVWENVPGVLSSNGGRDFASLLRGMAELGYGFAYRILDAQHFGVPQRRRRVFVVGHLGNWQRAAAVLFEQHSLQGHTPPSREAGKGTAPPIAGCSNGGGANGPGRDVTVAIQGSMIGRSDTAGPAGPGFSEDGQSFTLTKSDQHAVAYSMITANTGANGLGVAAEVAPTLDRAQPCAIAFAQNQRDEVRPMEVAGALAGEPGMKQQTFVAQPAVGFMWQSALGVSATEEGMGTMIKNQTPAVAFEPGIMGREGGHHYENISGTLRKEPGDNQMAVATAMQVRRLTPVECSRLQGFPDDYLELAYANADEAHAAQVLHELWREARTPVIEKQGWRTGIVAALLTPEILLSGVHGGWLSWEMATRCAAARGALSGEEHNHEGFVRALRQAGTAGRSPFGRESFEQFARELGSDLSILPLEGASARKVLRSSELWSQAQARWPLRYAFAKGKTGKAALMTPDGPRYKALGNSMAVPVMAWIGKRIQQVEEISCTTKQKYHSA